MIKNCGSCNAWKRDSGKQGHCQAHPPTTLLVGLAQGIAGPQPVINGFWPPVSEDHGCREWQPKLGTLNG